MKPATSVQDMAIVNLHEAASCGCIIAASCMVQALKPLLVDLPSAEIDPVLLAWTSNFQRLVMDNVR